MSRVRACIAAVAVVAAALAAGCAGRPCDPAFAASPQFSTGTCLFGNVANPEALPSQPGWKIWLRFLGAKPPGTEPNDAIPVRTLDLAALDALDPAANHIVRLGHSSLLLKLRGSYWLIDPVFGERASPFSFAGPKRFHPTPMPLAELPPIEAVILSHDHYDHLDVPTVAFLRERAQRWFVPLGVAARLRDNGVAASRIQEFDWWQEASHAGVQLTAAPAQHFSGRSLTDRNSTLWASWVIESGGERIFYSGDSGYFPGFAQIGARFGGFDVALMENGAYDAYWPAVHMTPEQTVKALLDVRGRLMYVVHNSTFDLAFHTWRDPLDRVAALAVAQGVPLATPEIGEVLTIGRPRENVLWWKGLR